MAQNMTQDILSQMIEQNKMTCGFSLDQVSSDNLHWRLNDSTASIGFIYRHIGETMNLFGNFLDVPYHLPSTTMGHSDTGQGNDYLESLDLIEKGYKMLNYLVKERQESWWMEKIDTPFFGEVSRFRLFAHVLYHTAHHTGQIALTLSRSPAKL